MKSFDISAHAHLKQLVWTRPEADSSNMPSHTTLLEFRVPCTHTDPGNFLCLQMYSNVFSQRTWLNSKCLESVVITIEVYNHRLPSAWRVG